MHFKIYVLIFQFMLYCNQYYFSKAEPLVGQSVRRARENEFSFIVSIGKISNVHPFCTGSLISRSHVLTSAHCFTDKEVTNVQVSIGSVDLRAAEKFPVSWWLTYDEWVDFKNMPGDIPNSDIAVLKLARSVSDLRIVPATLSPLNSFTAAGLSFNIAGWGNIEDNIIPRYLRVARVNAISLMQCSQIFSEGVGRGFMVVPFTNICTQATPPTLIKCGDSGGPLFTDNNEIIGINDSGCREDWNDENKVNFHICIDIYRDFIADVITY